MKTTWIIENLVKEKSYLELAEAVSRSGHDLLQLNGDYDPSLLATYQNRDNVLVVASIQMNQLIRETLPNAKLFSTRKNYLCSHYYPRLGQFLFNDQYVMLPLAEMVRQKNIVYSWIGKENCVFIRPDDGNKTFAGQILEFDDVDAFQQINMPYNYDLAVVSTPKNVMGEWRFVVNRFGKILAQSCYRYRGLKNLSPTAPEEAVQVVKKILETGFYPDDIFCIDIAEGADHNYYLLELTAFSSAGLYGADKDAVVSGVVKTIFG